MSIYFAYHVIVVVILCWYKDSSLEPPVLRPRLEGMCVVPYFVHACTIFIYMYHVDPLGPFFFLFYISSLYVIVIFCCYKDSSLEPPVLRLGLEGICVVPYFVPMHAQFLFICVVSTNPFFFFFRSIHFVYHVVVVVILCCYKGSSLEPPGLCPDLKGICVVPYFVPMHAQILFICAVSTHPFFYTSIHSTYHVIAVVIFYCYKDSSLDPPVLRPGLESICLVP